MKQILAIFMLSTSIAMGQTGAIQSATMQVDTKRVENHISPRMYASFAEMMAEKSGYERAFISPNRIGKD